MSAALVYPYYFPTTAVFLDDDRDFLFNFSLQLDDDLSYHLFDSSQKAKQYIEQQAIRKEPRTFFKINPQEIVTSTNPIIAVNVSELHQQAYNRRRFSEISVLVVDYAMPEMDGLTFCRQFENTGIKKILLTGKASEQLAIEAFNEGLIDQYIQKGDPQVVKRINQSIKALQHAYFKSHAQLLIRSFMQDELDFLYEKSFADYFARICAKQKTVEYYLMNKPSGFLLLDEEARPSFLLVQSAKDLQVHHAIAEEEEAPAACLNVLLTGEQIPYFWKTEGHYQKALSNEWKQYFYPAEKVAGSKQNYYCALIEDPPFPLLAKEVSPYGQYLEKLDFVLTDA